MSQDFCFVFGEGGEDASLRNASGNSFLSKWRRVAVHTLNCNNYMLFIRRKSAAKHASPVEGIFPLTSEVDYKYQYKYNSLNSATFDVLI